MKYAYFPGCSLHSTAIEYDKSARAICGDLGLELVEIEDWLCCGATPAHITSHMLSLALPLSSCAWAEKNGLNIVTCCAACFSRLKLANLEIRGDGEVLNKVNDIIEEGYEGKTEVFHLLEILVRDVGVDHIRKRVERDLGSLKVASYYGCLLTRLPEAIRIDDPEDPSIMDDLIVGLGGRTIDWPYKTECCGASLALIQKKTVIRLVHDILRIAKDHGAECIAVACPLCQSNLDLYQAEVNKSFDTKFNMPVFYFTQLVGLAIGLDVKRLGLEKLIVDPTPLLIEKGIIEEEVYL